ncbi:MAG: N-acetylmuramoyl-L-alanine amidase [Rhodospirillaceae bacterium]|nr:N-acetylmuramoyl-L-alanine amidase [Rhodospirillaceae bacterium]
MAIWSRTFRVVLIALTLATGFAAGARALTVTDARAWKHPDYTRFVMELSERVDYDTFTLADPYRLVIDMPQARFAVSPAAFGSQAGIISRVRFGLYKPGTSRVVLDLAGPARVKSIFVLPPQDNGGYRLVIDLEGEADTRFRRTARRGEDSEVRPAAAAQALAPEAPPPAAIRSAAVPVPPPPFPPRDRGIYHTIVVDPGHGGVDPGAISINGNFEKDLALDVARQLRRVLIATGRYKVVMTRDKDVYLTLRERVDVARAAGADAFVSVHADSMADKSHRGTSVYTLSETASDSEAEALATKENKSDIIAGVDFSDKSPEVASILIDLAQRETNNQSERLAAALVGELKRGSVRVIHKPHRQAGFRVLKSPDVPSILVEFGYLSNTNDERLLLNPEARRPIIDAIVRTLDRHFETLTAKTW